MAKTVNEDIQDWSIRHQAWINRYSAGEANKILEMTKEADRLISKEIRGTDNLTTKKEYRALLKSVKVIEDQAAEKYLEELNTDLQEFSEWESSYQVRNIERSLNEIAGVKTSLSLPSPEQVWLAVNSRPMTAEGVTRDLLQPFIKGIPASRLQQMETTITTGFTLGWSNQKISNEIFGEVGSINASRNATKSIVRTSTNHTASVSRERTFKENSDIVKGYEWNATLDTRTSEICAVLDGKVWRYDNPERSTLDGPRLPPAHPNCRSTTIPFLVDWREAGFDIPEGTRSSMNGYVPASIKFPQWFESQTAKFQRDWLGPTRYNAWKDGKIKISDLVKNNKPLNLEELKLKE